MSAKTTLNVLPANVPLEIVTLSNRSDLISGGDALVDVRVPKTWPPRVDDDPDGAGTLAGFKFIRDKLASDSRLAGWWGWFVVMPSADTRTLVGTVSPTGPPDGTGTVEVGYSIVREHEGRGLATEATRALVEWVRRDARVRLSGQQSAAGAGIKAARAAAAYSF